MKRAATKLFNLEHHKRINGNWVHQATLIWNGPYSLCCGEKRKREVNKAHFEFYKVVPNQK